MQKKVLSKEVAEKFNLKGVDAGKHDFSGFGVVDLTAISLADAECLVKAGFTWLEPKEQKEPKQIKESTKPAQTA